MRSHHSQVGRRGHDETRPLRPAHRAQAGLGPFRHVPRVTQEGEPFGAGDRLAEEPVELSGQAIEDVAFG